MKVERFDYALGGMRKPDSWIVYPRKTDESYIIAQSSRAIALVKDDGTGLLNWRGSNPKYFLHLSPALGAQHVTFPKEFVGLVREFMPSSGDLIGSSPMTGPVYLD
jgi:hypothetical protein